jgi:hypothetical protein
MWQQDAAGEMRRVSPPPVHFAGRACNFLIRLPMLQAAVSSRACDCCSSPEQQISADETAPMPSGESGDLLFSICPTLPLDLIS